MTQTTTDYLFQLTPVPDRSSFSAANASGGDTFDDHLSQASTVAGDDSRSIGNDPPKPAAQSYDDWDSNNTSIDDGASHADASKTTHSNENSASDTFSSSEKDGPAEKVNDKQEPADEVDGDDHDTDKVDETVSAMPSTGPGPCDPKQNNLKLVSGRTTTFPAALKADSANVQPADRADDHSKNENTGSQAQRIAQVANVVAAETESEKSTAIDRAQPQIERVAELQSSNEKKTTSKRSTSRLDTSETDAEATHDKLQAALDEVAEQRQAAQKIGDNVQANSKSSTAMAENSVSDADASSDDDSSESHNDSRASSAAGATNKTVTALSTVTALVTDATANVPSTSDENKPATKDAIAKVETNAAGFARLSRSSSGANRSGGTANADEGPRVDPARFVGRVAKAFQTAQDRGGTLQLRLSPPELGSLRLELTVKDGVMSAALQTENANARRLLLDHLPALRDRLAEQNIRVDRFDVDVRREGTGGQADTRGSQQQQFQHQPEHPAPRRQATPPPPRETAPQEIVRGMPSVSDAGLNLIV